MLLHSSHQVVVALVFVPTFHVFFFFFHFSCFGIFVLFPWQGQMTVDAAMPLQKEAVKSVNVMCLCDFICLGSLF